MTIATEMKSYLRQLHAERALAALDGVSAAAYLADLDDEIAAAWTTYTVAAVNEIAMLRGELYARLEG